MLENSLMKGSKVSSSFVSVINNYTIELVLIILAIGTLLIAAPIITEAKYSADVTSKEDIVNKKNKGIILLDRHGTQFFSFYDGRFREYTPLSQISEEVQNAVIVVEDKEFYQHNGISVNAIIGATIANFKKGDMAYGGSTITQQLVKNTLLNNRKDLFRKYEEVVLAQEIEKRYTKKEILEMYLNSVYFGEGAYGIEDAAHTYFNKDASELDISEASMLAGLITAPSTLSPVSGDKQKAKARQLHALNKMVQAHYLTDQERNQAAKKELAYVNGRKKGHFNAPHYALLVKQKLIEKYGEKYLTDSGMKVYTTLDLSMQAKAEETVQKQVESLVSNNGTNASAIVMDPKTGQILALVGSANWYNTEFGKVNMAVSPRQPGSAFKPIVYAAGFESHQVTPATVLLDAPRNFGLNYRPKNYDNRFRGPVSARYALANSLNVPSVEVMTKVGMEDALGMAKRLGINSLKDASQYGPSLVLGAGEVTLLELTNVYATFANEGERHEPMFITKIEDKYGKVIEKPKSVGKQVIDAKYVFLVSSILSDKDVRRDVFGSALDISRTAAVKTGTTENYKDAWTVGYTPGLAIGVWVGNNNNAEMDHIAGSLGAAPIWRELMEDFSKDMPEEKFIPPSGIIAQSVCSGNGYRSFSGSSVRTEYFVSGTQGRRCRPIDNSRFAFKDEVNTYINTFIKPKDTRVELPRVGAAESGQQNSSPQPTLTPPQDNPYLPADPSPSTNPDDDGDAETNENGNERERDKE